MPLVPVSYHPDPAPLPPEILAICEDAQARIEGFLEARRESPLVAFVPSDFHQVYRALRTVDERMLAPGRRFAEWGSGVGVVSCLAAMIGFDAVGIEIEPELVDLSRQLAREYDVEVEFVEGSFLPLGAEELVDQQVDVTWLRTDGSDAYAVLGLEPDDFDVVFAYPWPGEEQIMFDLFATYASVGSLLITFHGQDGIQMQRKRSRK